VSIVKFLPVFSGVLLLAGCQGGDQAETAAKANTTVAVPEPSADQATHAANAPIGRETASQFDPAIPQELRSPPAESGGECGIEATADVPQGAPLKLSRAQDATIEGWALVRGSKTDAESVYLKLASDGDASYFVPVKVVNRPGLGIRLGDAGLDRAGFAVVAGLQNVTPGEYTVQVAQRVAGRVLLCATGRSATVTE
jgi:hypothetical protein